MKFTVVWQPAATDMLASLWMEAPDRKAFSVAANQIDVRLRTNPATWGEPREGVERALTIPLIAVVYEVHEEDRIVSILSIRLWTED